MVKITSQKKRFQKHLWNFSHTRYHQIWWFHKIVTKFCEFFSPIFVTSKFTKILEEKITKHGENYFTKKCFNKICEDFLTPFITKFSDSLKFSPNLVNIFSIFLSPPTLGVLPRTILGSLDRLNPRWRFMSAPTPAQTLTQANAPSYF